MGYDCTMKKPEDWDIAKRAYCCRNPPYYCAPYTKGCDAPCLYGNVTLSCQARIGYRHRVAYKKKDDGCLRAYWDVMDQCPVCQDCLAVDAGCNRSKTDCSGDPDHEKWDDATREFCCLKQGKACPSLRASPVKVKQTLFDCEDHFWDWTSSWSQEQKDWCCKHQRKGCKGMKESKAPRSKAHIPDADFQIILSAEQMLKRNGFTWESLRTPGPSESSVSRFTKPFRCDVALDNFHAAWSQAKKAWCCQNEQKGCSLQEPALQLTYDCRGDTIDWPRAKRDWCCIHKVIGCGEVEDDSVKFSRGSQMSGKGGEPLEKPREQEQGGYAEFDCTVEVDNWQFAWAEEQKVACCKTVGIGCKDDELDIPEPSEADNFFDCSKDQPSNWSPKKKEVCCASNADCQRRLQDLILP